MQFNGKQPLGVVYNTSMDRPDAALALAMLYGFTGKREARIGSVCVNGSGLGAAIFCDLVAHFYTPGPPRNANQVLPTGLALENPLPADSPMVLAAVDRKNDKGQPQYPRSFSKVSDTALAEAVIRNGVIYNAEAVVVLSAPATYLAKTLDLQGTKDIYKQRVKRLVIVDSGAPQDVAAMNRVLAEWPTPIYFCGKDVGPVVAYPSASVEKDFAWAPANPVVDAYKAFQAMPYNAPAWDLAALLYAVHPDLDLFAADAGTIRISANGAMSFAAGAGSHKALRVDTDKREKIVQSFVDLVSAKPAAPQQRLRPPQADIKAAPKAAETKTP
jgi:hypothetical protein